MTQEELNELIEKANFEEPSNELSEDDYKVNTENKWPPPPPTDSHKVVHQLDDVTRGIEILSLIHISEPTRQPSSSRMPSSA